MPALALILTPVPRGWAVVLTDGHQVARFSGPAARWRALRYLERYVDQINRNGW